MCIKQGSSGGEREMRESYERKESEQSIEPIHGMIHDSFNSM